MADIAKVGFEYDGKPLTNAKNDLENLNPAAVKAESAINKFSRTITEAGARVNTFSGKILGSLKEGLIGIGAGIAAGFAIEGVISKLFEMAQALDDVSKQSTKLHETMQNTQALALAADLAGQDFGQLAMSAQRMNRVLADAISKGKGTEGVFKLLGLSAQDLANMPLTDRFAALADRINELNPTADQLALILAKLGDRSGQLAALILGGSDGIRQAKDLLKEYGGELTSLDGQNIEAMNDSFTKLQYSISAIGNQLIAYFAPTITTIVTGLASGIAMLHRAFSFIINDSGILATAIRGAFIAALSFVAPWTAALIGIDQLLKMIFGVGLVAVLKGAVNIMINTWKGGVVALGTIIGAIPLIFELAFRLAVNAALQQVQNLVQGVQNAVNIMGAALSALSGNGFNFKGSTFEIPKLDNTDLKAKILGSFDKANSDFMKFQGVDNFADSNDKSATAVDNNTHKIIDLNDALGGTASKAGAATQQLTALQQISAELDKISAPFDQAKSAFEKLTELQTNGLVTGDQYTAMLGRIQAAFIATGGTAEQWGKIIGNKTNEMGDAIKGFATNSLTSLGDTLADLAVSGKADFKALADGIIKDLLRMMWQALVVKPILAFFGFADGGSFGGGIAGGAKAFANGGTFTNKIVNSPTAFAFANGGGFSRGVMGEAGAEAIVPLKRGQDGSLGVQAHGLGGGGASNHLLIDKIEVNVQGGSGGGDERASGGKIADSIVERIEAIAGDVFTRMNSYGGAGNPRGGR